MISRAPCVNQLGALAESGNTLGIRSFYRGDPDVIMPCLTCSTLSGCSCAMHTVWHVTGNHGGRWSNRMYVALALFCLLATCVVFWSHRRRDIVNTTVLFSPDRKRMYITLLSSACTSYPSLKRYKCIWWFGKATCLHELSSFLLSQ